MSVYTNQQAVEAYIEGWVTDDPFSLERLIQRSERDVDRIIMPLNVEQAPTQVISIMGATGGTFDLSWNGVNPQTITEPYSVTGAQLQTDLQAISDIGPGNVTVFGNNPYTLMWTYQWTTAFPLAYVPLVTVNPTNLQPSGAATAKVAEVEALKVNPLTDTDRNQTLALSRATCAQVEYRNQQGEAFFVRSQYESVRGPDFTTQGKLPYIAPKAFRELAQTGLAFRQGRAVAGSRRFGVGKGWATY